MQLRVKESFSVALTLDLARRRAEGRPTCREGLGRYVEKFKLNPKSNENPFTGFMQDIGMIIFAF